MAVAVAMVVRLWSFDVWARESWSGAVSTVSVLHSAFKRTKFRHLNRPQCKVMLFLVMAPSHPGGARTLRALAPRGCSHPAGARGGARRGTLVLRGARRGTLWYAPLVRAGQSLITFLEVVRPLVS